MSWNPFSRSSSSSLKKPVLSKPAQREFEKELKKLDDLEELTRRLYKDAKKLTEANNVLSKSERKLSQELLSTQLCQSEDTFKNIIDEWDAAMVKMDLHMTDRNVYLHRTVLEPLKKFVSVFPYAQVAVKKREQSLQEFQKCQDKMSKYQDRDRTGPNAVKLEMSKKALQAAQAEFTHQNTALMEDIPKMIDNRTDYFQPSLEAEIKSQVQYTTEAVKVYGELSNLMNGHREHSKHDYASQIQHALTELKALSITAD
ncbi:bridging integrator 3-like [Biomphalaria glabrata]|uniref:Bridging integrator 3-like n=2 Tax=Biomphalaria glabrata TaxID=6526 RepID=A0A9W2YAF3_BIOGL|nr:bridging integrator 3-like [Biomphalaria glabrata]